MFKAQLDIDKIITSIVEIYLTSKRARYEAESDHRQFEHEEKMLRLQTELQQAQDKDDIQRQKDIQFEIEKLLHTYSLEKIHLKSQLTLDRDDYLYTLNNFPLSISPNTILKPYEKLQEAKAIIPLLIILSPPRSDSNGELEKTLAEKLRTLLGRLNHYPTKLISGTWKQDGPQNEGAVQVLFNHFNHIPSLILDIEIIKDKFSLSAAFWHPDSVDFKYVSIVTGIDVRNFKDTTGAYDSAFLDFVAFCHSVVIGWICDSYYMDILAIKLLEGYRDINNPPSRLVFGPQLPAILPELIYNNDFLQKSFIEELVIGYEKIIELLEDRLSSWLPEAYLELAFSLISLRNINIVHREINNAIVSLLIQKKIKVNPQKDIGTNIDLLLGVASWDQRNFLLRLKQILLQIDEQDAVKRIEIFLNTLYRNTITRNITRDDIGDTP